ncbi:MAG: DUF4179 domain-containing protein [Oscillospiraceae bacterium]|jgi:hypothetical protein|nr:DUF4179 domain-containing protein [Oscillospiraceae bacterium]
MDRKQEYDTLMQELRHTPPALEGTLDRALARRQARRRRLRPLRSLAAAAAVFVLLVNVSTPFAQACSNIPILGWLAQAVCFSHSLSSAVEHDWVQKVDQTQRDSGYTLTLENLIVDQKQIHLFYTLAWEDPACEYAMVYVDSERLSPRPSVLSDSVNVPQDAGHIVLDYREEQVPDRLDLDLTVRPNGDGSPAARFRFQITLDPSLTAVGQILPVEQWVELDGQQICVDRLEIYPTHARLMLRDSPDNTARLVSLLCRLEDETGRQYEREGGLSGFSDPDTGFLTELRLASPYFQQPERLTLRITGAVWQDPEEAEVTVDLAAGTAAGLPEEVQLTGVDEESDRTVLYFQYPAPPALLPQRFSWTCRSPEGEWQVTEGGSGTDTDTGLETEDLHLIGYPWDQVTLTLNWTRFTPLDVSLPLPAANQE